MIRKLLTQERISNVNESGPESRANGSLVSVYGVEVQRNVSSL